MPLYGKIAGKANTVYDICARKLFLKTIKPKEKSSNPLGNVIMECTHTTRRIENKIGFQNLTYLLALALLNKTSSTNYLWLYGASFVHYLMYIANYRYRKDISFTNFKRNAKIFKIIALCNIAYLLCHNFDNKFHFRYLVALFGIVISMTATYRLGEDYTLFGYESGFCPPKWVDKWPYGKNSLIPHPMILGQVLLYGTVLSLPCYRNGDGVPPFYWHLHIALYLIHALQEHQLIGKN